MHRKSNIVYIQIKKQFNIVDIFMRELRLVRVVSSLNTNNRIYKAMEYSLIP